MSTKELLDEADKLLSSDWASHEKELVTRMINSLIAYKSFIPKSLKNDVKAMLQMANRIKAEYDELLKKYKTEKNQLDKDTDELKELHDETSAELHILNKS